MELIVLIGAQGAGKSTFCAERYGSTHLRLNLDMLRTRHRLTRLLEAALETKTRVVLDNTNPTADVRRPFVLAARAAGFRVVAVHFDVPLADCLGRNARRSGKALIPEKGVRATARRLEAPSLDEGFDEIHRVTVDNDTFHVETVAAAAPRGRSPDEVR